MSSTFAPRVGAGHSDVPHPSTAILVVESDGPIGSDLVEQLRADRYPAVHARTQEHARVLARAQTIRAIVLGVLDTPCGALDLLDEIRRTGTRWPSKLEAWDEDLPAIVLSPSVTQLALLRAFEAGADDFVAYPPSYLELRARLRAVLRLAERSTSGRLVRAGGLEIDTGAHRVRFHDGEVDLCRLEYELLLHLARSPATVCSKQELLRAVWGQRPGLGARTVDSHASRLRRKLEGAGASGLVVNVWGVGYRLV
jgi:two-component system response regulator AdeR